METINWNQDRVERLEMLYRDGLSFSLIANEIGVTRSAAIGKAHRLKLPTRRIVQAKPRHPPKTKPRPDRPVIEQPVIIIPDIDYRCTIYDLNDSSCRFPMWDLRAAHSDRLYCGHPSASFSVGIPYCERHTAVSGSLKPI